MLLPPARGEEHNLGCAGSDSRTTEASSVSIHVCPRSGKGNVRLVACGQEGHTLFLSLKGKQSTCHGHLTKLA